MGIFRKHAATIIGTVFFLLGFGLSALTLSMARNRQAFVKSASHASGKVTQMTEHHSHDSRTYHPKITFVTDDGTSIEFESSSGSSPPAHRVGDTIAVLYNPNNPYEAEIDSFMDIWMGSVIAGFLGITFAAVGAGILVSLYRRAKTKQWLKERGVRVNAEFSTVRRAHVKVGNQYGLLAVASWQNPKTGETVAFESDVLWKDPELALRGKTVPVMIDPSNPKRHWVDLSGFPELT